MNSRILVSGVSGPIGAALLPSLLTNGCSIVRLVRGPSKADDQISWDPAVPLAPQTVSGFDAVIHLAGESIIGRWTDAKRATIRDPRIVGTFNLASAFARAKRARHGFPGGGLPGLGRSDHAGSASRHSHRTPPNRHRAQSHGRRAWSHAGAVQTWPRRPRRRRSAMDELD